MEKLIERAGEMFKETGLNFVDDAFVREMFDIARRALDEDLGSRGDITTKAVCAESMRGEAEIMLNESAIVAGMAMAHIVFSLLDERIEFSKFKDDGERGEPGEIIAEVSGPLSSILQGERVALNFLSHLSGIATATYQFTEIASKYGVKVSDTRKTMPNMRKLQKYAVKVGGGKPHRMGLYDEILIKDNHIAIAGGVRQSIEAVRGLYGEDVWMEVEVSTIDQLREALELKPAMIMLDNMNPETVIECVKICEGKVELEVSGGINISNMEVFARTGIDRIAIGALTHSVKSVDMNLEILGIS